MPPLCCLHGGKGREKINIKIDVKQPLEKPDSCVEVVCTGLEVFFYWSKGQPQVGAKAIVTSGSVQRDIVINGTHIRVKSVFGDIPLEKALANIAKRKPSEPGKDGKS